MTTPLDTLYLWVGQPADQPEHLVMMLVPGDEQSSGEDVYRPLMAVTREHADQLTELAQQAADGLGVPVVLREYEATGAVLGNGVTLAAELARLEPQT